MHVLSDAPESAADLGERLGLLPEELQPYGRRAAKIELSALERLAGAPDGRIVSVTALTPTKAGEGKTTTAIALTEALGVIGAQPVLCLREPSLGPVFGIKGGGTGGGLAQLAAMDLVNLHFTGDIHAIGAANNLLAAMLEAHLLHGNALGVDPHSITWRRCLDMDDRALRQIVVGLGGRTNGTPRETGFDITAASEVMAIVAVSEDAADLRRRLDAITVATTFGGEPVTAGQLGAAGSMAALLVDALKPNLAQTLEGQPAIVHCGPFANIAHGNNSVLADRLALKLGEVAVTESGFGADMGFEKFVDIVCRGRGLAPSAVVLVATTQALKHHGGDPDGGVPAIERGAENLAANMNIVREIGIDPVVAINHFPSDERVELDAIRSLSLELGALGVEENNGFERGGEGAVRLAEVVLEAVQQPVEVRPLYELDESIPAKIDAVARRAYGASGIELSPAAARQAEALAAAGLDRLPICIAKTHLSLSHDASLGGTPTGFTLPVRELRPYTGAGWIVVLCGDMQTMPGLPAEPAALGIDVDSAGHITGLR